MATYRNIASSEVAIDAPLTQQLMQALKDNVLAIAEGDATASAVRITPQALTPALLAGDNQITIVEASYGGSSTLTTQKTRFRIGGTFRFKITYVHTDQGGIGNDDGSVTIRKYDAAGNFVENIYSQSDSGGSTTYNVTVDTAIVNGGSFDALLNANNASSVAVTIKIGVSSNNVIGDAVLFKDIND